MDEPTEQERERWRLEDVFSRLERRRSLYYPSETPIATVSEALTEILNRIEAIESRLPSE